MKSAVKSVWLNRAEGRIEECVAVTIPGGPDVGKKVLDVLFGWGHTAPEQGGGYDKTDFRVEWENGESYDGRFDLQRGGTDGGERFWDSLKSRLEYAACVRRPAHFKDEHWAHHCEMYEKEGWKAQAEAMLAGCEIPV